MVNHLLVPIADISSVSLLKEHKKWLMDWSEQLAVEVENGVISSSLCLQGLITELILDKKPVTDWCGIIDEYLLDDNGNPLAYSEGYGKKLYSFPQWLQTPVHAVHTVWWIQKSCKKQVVSDKQICDLIKTFIQPNGWIYNANVSKTNLRTRMKSELLMSFAQGIEILNESKQISSYEKQFQSTISSFPITDYLSSEYFRIRALEMLDSINLAPTGIDQVIKSCETGTGYCDFSLKSKVDDYMGTAKRTSRDKTVFSPLSTLHAVYLSKYINSSKKADVKKIVSASITEIKKDPLLVPSFKIRDVDIPFGDGISPLEVISASILTSL